MLSFVFLMVGWININITLFYLLILNKAIVTHISSNKTHDFVHFGENSRNVRFLCTVFHTFIFSFREKPTIPYGFVFKKKTTLFGLHISVYR